MLYDAEQWKELHIQRRNDYINDLKEQGISGAISWDGQICTIGDFDSSFNNFKEFIAYQALDMGGDKFCAKCGVDKKEFASDLADVPEDDQYWEDYADNFNGWRA